MVGWIALISLSGFFLRRCSQNSFYVPPGHIGVGNEPDTEYVQFSPSEELRAVDTVMAKNMQAMMQGS